MSDSQKPTTPRDLISELGSILTGGSTTGKDKNAASFLDDAVNSLQDVASPLIASLTDALKAGTPEPRKTEVPTPSFHKEEVPTPRYGKPAPKAEAKPDVAPETKDVFAEEAGTLNDIADFVVDGIANVGSLFTNFFKPEAPEAYVYEFEVDLTPEPAVDIIERKDSIEYRIAVAGAGSEDVSVELDGDELHIKVSTPKSADVNIGDEPLVAYVEQGIWSGDWEETFYIPSSNLEGRNVEVDAEGITAVVKNGLATVVVPFKEQVKATIKVG